MATPTTVRKFLEQELKPLLPVGWGWVSNQRTVDAIQKTTVIFKQLKISRLPAAPIGHVLVEGVLTIVSPHQDTIRAEDKLDETVLELVTEIDGLERITWAGAEKVQVGDQNLGWDIHITVTAKKEQ